VLDLVTQNKAHLWLPYCKFICLWFI